ncbi:sensory neuron membrane protein 2-like [Cloeon dipterum]|uniref:sensory neuron membrane protein 2-like n=1 Tax=Cloeon dipterum TaxID=197152 RepID=UPI00321FC97F
MACNIGGWIAGLGAILVTVGVVFGWVLLPYMIEDEIIKNVVLAKDSTSYKFWNKLSQPVEFKVYIWEVENPDEVQSNGAKPKMKETGPYTYLLNRAKENIKFSEDGNFVEYEQRTFYKFSPELSGPSFSEDDEVTVLNSATMGLVLAADIVDDMWGISAMSVAYEDLFGDYASVFTKIKVRDLLFDGMMIKCKENHENIFWEVICGKMAENYKIGLLTPFIRYDEKNDNYFYSFLNHKNGKTDGHFKVMTGKSDVSKLGQIVEWEHNSTLQFWSGDECNTIRGSDATIFPPFLNEETKINVYSTDLCRSLYMTYDQKIGHSGIDGHRYVVDPVQLGNVSSMPENYCYCPPNGACLKDGANDLTNCYSKTLTSLQYSSGLVMSESPVIFSLPHFYGAPQYEQMVENLKPDKEKHQMFLDVETNTGAPLRAGRRVQFNLMIKPLRCVNITKDLPEAVLPLFWVDEALELNKENTDFLKDIFVNKISLVDNVRWTLLGVGCVLFLIGTALHCHKQTAPMKNKGEVPM